MAETISGPLQWEGVADRSPARFVALRVTGVAKDGGGLFGLGNSPSIVGALPDPRVITGTSLSADAAPIKLRVPGGELPPALGPGARLVLGVVEPNAVICLLVPPDPVSDDGLQAWAAKQRCS